MLKGYVAIAGSADPERQTELNLTNLESIDAAAEAVGTALSKAGYGIVVYSGSPTFIEAAVVKGYLANPGAETASIRVLYPRGLDKPVFEGSAGREQCFHYKLDPNPDWEVSFFASLSQVDGLVLLGGGQTTFSAGLFAKAFQRPIVALEAFGGAARRVYECLSPSEDLVDDDDKSVMAEPYTDQEWAHRVVGLLAKQMERKRADER
ncbi:MAG: hypothetical protein GY953_29415, partial [bacterium]|nr:hypothetical protein [bacterium]